MSWTVSKQLAARRVPFAWMARPLSFAGQATRGRPDISPAFSPARLN